MGTGHKAHFRGKGHHQLCPRVSRRQRNLHLGDDPIQAPGMAHLEHLVSPQLQHPRLFLQGDHPQTQDVAAIPQLAVGHRANAAAAAGNEPPDGGRAIGGRSHADLPAHLPGVFVDGHQLGPRLHPRQARLCPKHLVELAHVQDHTPGQRDTLAVITGTGTAHRNRDPQPGTGRCHPHHLGLIGGAHHQISPLVAQLSAQHGAVVVKIQRQLGHLSRISDDLNTL
jgi:hypothetical protein